MKKIIFVVLSTFSCLIAMQGDLSINNTENNEYDHYCGLLIQSLQVDTNYVFAQQMKKIELLNADKKLLLFQNLTRHKELLELKLPQIQKNEQMWQKRFFGGTGMSCIGVLGTTISGMLWPGCLDVLDFPQYNQSVTECQNSTQLSQSDCVENVVEDLCTQLYLGRVGIVSVPFFSTLVVGTAVTYYAGKKWIGYWYDRRQLNKAGNRVAQLLKKLDNKKETENA